MATASKPKCKYWDNCFRKDPTHISAFSHPNGHTPGSPTKKKPVIDDKTDDADGDRAPAAATSTATTAATTTTTTLTPQKKRKADEDGEDKSKTKKTKKTTGWDMSDSEDDNDDATEAKASIKPDSSTTKAVDATSDSDEPTVTLSLKKPKCKYWDTCFRTNAIHLRAFLHPADMKQKNKMKDGDFVDVKSGDTTYQLKRTGDSYYCTCIGWKQQTNPVDKRTCKHLGAHLGEEYEQIRLGEYAARRSRRVASTSTDTKPKPKSKAMIQLLLAHKWTDSVDPKGWWMSEKLDGVRAWWDGRKFRSRLGNTFYAPGWFTKDYPTDMELDGELFGGRGMFQATVSIVKSSDTDERWKKVVFHVFDAPNVKDTFEKRMEALEDYFSANTVTTVKVVDQTKCKNKEHLQEELKRINGAGGEGVMIRQPKSKYENCRSKTLLKLKTFHDAEARVVGYKEGKGMNQGRVGALRVQMANGKEFSVGSGLTDAQRRKPPKKGTIIVYKFQEYSNSGTPRFPTFVGEAADKTEPKDCILTSNKELADNADS
ncbi:uncharacterized protein LOC100366927 isoform X2 [Saccoglossus kowalevskii]|uniref:Uncharacterized protein LOC100366927 isoform X2 n=1 Tax=Saccoglossus kowalevskii TaxID=10224 RepID=A0ABM0MK59_SACKO|nr:PREDICTED: uncharacterized protein LOC100366927 isoform X2 [Saccoglossus kowalevskii]